MDDLVPGPFNPCRTVVVDRQVWILDHRAHGADFSSDAMPRLVVGAEPIRGGLDNTCERIDATLRRACDSFRHPRRRIRPNAAPLSRRRGWTVTAADGFNPTS